HLTALEYEQGWNTANSVAHGGRAVAVHVHFADFELACVLSSQFIYDWGDRAAGSAPSRPEVHQHRCLRLEDILIEARIGDLCNSISCHGSSNAKSYRLRCLYPSTPIGCDFAPEVAGRNSAVSFQLIASPLQELPNGSYVPS